MIYSYFRIDDQPLQPEVVTGGEDRTRLTNRPEWPPESRTESSGGETRLLAKALQVLFSTLQVLKRPGSKRLGSKRLGSKRQGSKRQGSKLCSWKPSSPKLSGLKLQSFPEQFRSYYSTDLLPRLLRVCLPQAAHQPVSHPLPVLAP